MKIYRGGNPLIIMLLSTALTHCGTDAQTQKSNKTRAENTDNTEDDKRTDEKDSKLDTKKSTTKKSAEVSAPPPVNPPTADDSIAQAPASNSTANDPALINLFNTPTGNQQLQGVLSDPAIAGALQNSGLSDLNSGSQISPGTIDSLFQNSAIGNFIRSQAGSLLGGGSGSNFLSQFGGLGAGISGLSGLAGNFDLGSLITGGTAKPPASQTNTAK